MIDSEAVIELMPESVRGQVAPVIRTCGTKIGVDACDNAFLTNKCYYEQNPEVSRNNDAPK